MKNIHVLSTNKPSRLFIIDKSKMFKSEAPYLSFSTVGGRVHKVEGSKLYQPQNMYITSDEKLTIGGYHFNSKYGDEPRKTHQRDIDSRKYWEQEDYYISKIILTTDEDLINSGVQKIDDEFLEWFIKNNDCEFVEIEKMYRKERNDTGMIGSPMSFTVFDKYKINIPEKSFDIKEFEQKANEIIANVGKEELIKMMEDDEKLGLYGANIIDTWLEKYGDPEISKQVEREAEELMLEEAAEKEYPHALYENDWNALQNRKREEFKKGANWQAERMYSEEEVLEQLNLLHNMRSSKIDTYTDEDDCITTKWFKQFK